jgi:hypothetical protein
MLLSISGNGIMLSGTSYRVFFPERRNRNSLTLLVTELLKLFSGIEQIFQFMDGIAL